MCISYKVMPLKKVALHKTERILGQNNQLWRNNNARVERLQQEREEAFRDSEPKHDETIIIDATEGPKAILQLRTHLANLPSGISLKIGMSSKVLAKELAAAARLLGYQTVELQFRRQHFLYLATASGAV